MRIAVISTPVFQLGSTGLQGYGGLEQIAWLTAKGLAERGHRVKLVAPDGSNCPGVEVVPIGQAGHWGEKQVFSRYREAILDCDAIIDHSWQKLSYALKMEGRFNGPILGVCHAPIDGMYRTLPPGVDKPCFVCISKDQAAHFEAIHGRPARVCYNGIDIAHYSPTGVPRIDRFLFLARFSSIKGPDLALEACYRAGVGLDLIGDTSITNEPDYFRQCCKMAERTSSGWDNSKGKQFRMIGAVGRGESVFWFSQAHCMLHPNQRFREPLGLAPLEAMLCGTPCIAWAYGAMKETIGDPEYLVDSMDKLVEVVKQKANPISDDYREWVREWASRWSVEAMVTRYEELCEEALEGGW